MRITTLIFDYRCAVCWSALIERDDRVVCARYGTDHAGYHRLSGIEWQRAHSDHDKREVIALYREVEPFCYQLGLAEPRKTGSDLQAAFDRNRRALRGDDAGL